MTLEPTEDARLDDAASILRSASRCEWRASMETFRIHRITPLIAHAVLARGLVSSVPQAFLHRLRVAHRKTLLANTVLMQWYARALGALRERGVEPVVWKGVVLADSFYPDLGARWMGDIDFAIEASELPATTEALESIGLTTGERTEDAVYFVNSGGVAFDVHHRVRLFENHDPRSLTIDIPPVRSRTASMRVLEPTAMVAHLVYHMEGHRREMGPLLSRFVDLAFVLRRWGPSIDFGKLSQLLGDQELFVAFLRSLRFLAAELAAPSASVLAESAGDLRPYTLAEVLRQRRLGQWGLPRPRGWARLGACRLGVRPRRDRVYPQLGDLVWWPLDAIRERRARRRFAAGRRGDG